VSGRNQSGSCTLMPRNATFIRFEADTPTRPVPGFRKADTSMKLPGKTGIDFMGSGVLKKGLSPAAVEQNWKGFVLRVLEECGPEARRVIRWTHADSYEFGAQMWTP
jgi:hypothetical protein